MEVRKRETSLYENRESNMVFRLMPFNDDPARKAHSHYFKELKKDLSSPAPKSSKKKHKELTHANSAPVDSSNPFSPAEELKTENKNSGEKNQNLKPPSEDPTSGEKKGADLVDQSSSFGSLLEEQEKAAEEDEAGEVPDRPGRLSERLSKLQQMISINDFEMLSPLGDGAYGKVLLVRNKQYQTNYALKIVEKAKVVKVGKVEHVHRERDIMLQLEHTNIIRLECTFQDASSLFFLLELAPNGNLSTLIKRMRKLPLELTKFYAAELVSALEYMRGEKVAHRDLKPENVLLDSKWHVKISDFGDAKVVNEES